MRRTSSSRISSLTIRALLFTGIAAGSLLPAGVLRGATWVPTGAGSFSWNSNSNWTSPATFPNAAAAVANLNVALSGSQTINLNQAITVGTLQFGASNTTGFLQNIQPNGGSLTFNNSGSQASLLFDSGTAAGTDIVSANITLQDNLLINQVDGSGGILTISGTITSAANQSLTVRGTRPVNLNGTINLGTGNFGMTDTPTVTIGGVGNVWGNTNISRGTLNLGVNNALPTATVVTMGQNFLNANAVTLDLSGKNQELAGLQHNAGANNNQTHSVTSSTAATLTINNSSNYTFGSSTISGVITGAVALVKAGSGTFTLGGANTYSGLTTVNDGTLLYGANNVIDTGAVTVNGASAILDLATFSDSVGTVTLQGGGQISGTGVLTSTSAFNVESGTASAGLAGPVSLTKTTTGTVILTGTTANTYTDNTFVNNGELHLDKTAGTNAVASNNLFVGDGVGAAASAVVKLLKSNQIADTTDLTIYSDGKFDLNSKDETINNLLDGSPAGGTVDGSTGTPTFTVRSGNFSGVITDTAGTLKLVKSTSGNLQLNGANSYAGATDVLAGILAIGAANDRLPTTTVVTIGDGVANTSGKLRLSELSSPTARNQEVAGLLTAGTGATNRVVGGAAGTSVLTVNIASGTDTYDGFLGGPGPNENNLALTKTGAGTLTLTAANTYLGVTNVNGGILALNGTHTPGAGAGLYTVNNGGTLKGSGITNGNLTVLAGGTVAPGNSIESLGVGDILINGGTFEYEINTTLLTADLLYGDNNSTLTLTNNPLLTMIDLGSNAVVPLFTKFTLIAYDGLWNGGTFLGHPDDSAFNFGANTWLINYNDTTPGSNFVADATLEGTAFVTITAIVPEPSTWLLGIIGLVALACRAWAGIRWAAETAAETVSGTFS